MGRYEQRDIDLAANHINSYPRGKWNGLPPVKLFETLYGSSVAKKLGIEEIPTKDRHITVGVSRCRLGTRFYTEAILAC